MVQAEAFRQMVVARAGGACEYCRLMEAGTGVTFHIEHVHPQSKGGETVFANLALSCPGCNLAKGGRNLGVDRSATNKHCSARVDTNRGCWDGISTSSWTASRD